MIGEMSSPPRLGMNPADRRQHRLGDPVQELGHRGDELVARIHDIEGDQPGQDGGGDQKPDVKVKDDENDVEDGAHVGGAREVGQPAKYRFPARKQGKFPAKCAENRAFHRS